MKVDHHHLYFRRLLLQYAVGGGPGAVDWLHEDAAHQAYDAHLRAIGCSDHRETLARRGGGIIGRLDDVGLAIEHRVDLAPAINVVTERDAVDACVD